jgi:hypothetical protein
MPGHPLSALHSRVRVFTPEGKISREVYKVCERPDRKGNILLESPTRQRLRVHQRRLIEPERGDVALVFQIDNQSRTTCPVCGTGFVLAPDQKTIKCPVHGEFQLSRNHGARAMTTANDKRARQKADKPKARPANKALVVPVTIDFDAIKKVGQLWTRTGTKFDHPEIEVKTHTILIPPAGKRPGRKLCFNSYDGTWGKRPMPFDADRFASTGTDTTGKTIGYLLKRTIEQEMAKLRKDGYTQET